MATSFFKRFKRGIFGRISRAFRTSLEQLTTLFTIPAPGAFQLIQRITISERRFILPLKTASIGMLLYSFYFSPSSWMTHALGALEIAVESTQYFFGVYIAVNVLIAVLLFNMHRLPAALIEWSVVIICLVDGIFVAVLTLVTGGPDSVLYWLFPALIIRSAVSVPRGTSQLILNLTLSAAFGLACLFEIAMLDTMDET